ncbi:galactose-1-phosphate uridylyltransferase [Hydrogenivirga sp. 128-5-R1-1]|uniref:galactose-1-phosphate uridylyltransferase n=1 Tax=Hydrogenivirga sp. 128-5-R1-1 TaxID=392423 RepID=UPI00015F0CBB|nr:galactose-1-phosphate uridylyltransferase [Hydrogenivirga sp. 128-5-R1-1]EDP74122.1 galactose-1-phosphate uridylyltransferase, putative [Hydrogenivirga sp. 128-5-R1-1]
MPEIRYNFLKDTYVIFSTERAKRPHDYFREPEAEIGIVEKCPFEYGNESKTPPEVFAVRENGSLPDTPGWKIRVVPNKYPALKPEGNFLEKQEGLFKKFTGYGYHEIIIETPDHFKQIYNFSVEEIKLLFVAVKNRFNEISKDKNIKYIQYFKNYGKEAGCSLFHSHSQIIAVPLIPKEITTKLHQLKEFHKKSKSCYICEEINFELKENKRIVYENEYFIAYCPYASIFPFEIRIIPKRHTGSFENIDDIEIIYLSEITKIITQKLYKTLNNPAFNMTLYTSPVNTDIEHVDKFNHWYIEILPRVNIIAGFELGTGWCINTTYPEDASKFLKESDI